MGVRLCIWEWRFVHVVCVPGKSGVMAGCVQSCVNLCARSSGGVCACVSSFVLLRSREEQAGKKAGMAWHAKKHVKKRAGWQAGWLDAHAGVCTCVASCCRVPGVIESACLGAHTCAPSVCSLFVTSAWGISLFCNAAARVCNRAPSQAVACTWTKAKVPNDLAATLPWPANALLPTAPFLSSPSWRGWVNRTWPLTK